MEGLLSKECVGKLERDGLGLMQLLRYVVETVDHTFLPGIYRRLRTQLQKYVI